MTERTAPRSTPKRLAAKLAEVMGEVGRLPKSGWNDFHKYAFATEAEVSDAVRGLLVERSICFLVDVCGEPERLVIPTEKGDRYITQLRVRLSFIDGETGEEISVSTIGQGEDGGDKGANKALTAAVKYGLLKLFLIPTGEDPDSGAETRPSKARGKSKPKPPPGDQVREALGALDEITQAQARELLADVGLRTPSDVTKENLAVALAAIAEAQAVSIPGRAELAATK